MHRKLTSAGQMRCEYELWSRKLSIGRTLGLVPTSDISLDIVRDNLVHLEFLRDDRIDYAEALELISESLARENVNIPSAAIDDMIKTVLQIGMLEIHPSDVCNLDCYFCSFKERRKRIFLNPDMIMKSRRLRPRVVWLSGGGEPTVYRGPKKARDFGKLVLYIRDILPSTEIAFATNGVEIPPGNWQCEIDWMRFSFDAASPETYAHLKGRDVFDVVRQNLRTYVMGPVPYIGVGFLFTEENMNEVAEFLSMMFDMFQDQSDLLNKVNVLLRPALPAGKDGWAEESVRSIHKISLSVQKKIEAMRSKKPRMGEFLEEQTNYKALGSYGPGLPSEFCLVPLGYRVLRGDGTLYPCILHVDASSMVADLNKQDSFVELKKEEIVSFIYYNKRSALCKNCLMSQHPYNAHRIYAEVCGEI